MSASRLALIMAGGTGGHIFPGLAVASELAARGWRVQWLGNPDAMEGRLVPARGIALHPLVFSGLRGKGLKALLFMPLRLLMAFAQALGVLRKVRPDVVLGMGGYVAFPGGMMASLLGIPLVVHEQNSVAGMTNRWLAKVADRSLVAFPGALDNAVWVGNPVRADMAGLPTPACRYTARSGSLKVLIVGGSLGAMALNTTVPQAFARVRDRAAYRITHQSGQAHLAQLQANYAHVGVSADCVAFIDNMADAMASADLVICRAGAMTVAEVAAVGVAALFVPFPFAVDDHQTGNARYLAGSDAAVLMSQSELTPERLATWLDSQTRESLLVMASKAREKARPQATQSVCDCLEELVNA